MFDFYLPLEDYFHRILIENEIKNWEAKIFWINIKHLNNFEEDYVRQQMYNALRILTTNDFLSVQNSKYNERIFLYSGTLKLVNLKQNLLKNNYTNLIKKEKNIIQGELEQYIFQKKFIEELYLKYPELAAKSITTWTPILALVGHSNKRLNKLECHVTWTVDS